MMNNEIAFLNYMNRVLLKQNIGPFFIVTIALLAVFFLLPEIVSAAGNVTGSGVQGADLSKTSIGTIVANPIDSFLYAILVMLGWIVNLGAVIVGAVTDVTVFKSVFESKTLQQGWFFVRDFFNIFFILILLFSAFATIFQVEKFHLKRTLLMIVLMALLVNFSWPIGLIIIDAGNVVMYFFMQNLFENPSGMGLMAKLSSESGIASVIVPPELGTALEKWANPASQLLFRIIFMFLFAITLVTIGAIFLLRLVMLAILMIFAPIGFVAAIFPSTQKFATMWWDNIFKWSFIGPIMLFMLALSIKLMQSLNQAGTTADGYYPAAQGLLSTAVQLTAAIVILWAGIIAASKIGGGAAGVITNKATGLAKWGGKKFSGYNLAQRHIGHWFKQRDAQKEDRARQRMETAQSWRDKKMSKLYSHIPFGGNAARDTERRADEMHDKRVADYMNNMKNVDNGGEIAEIYANARNKAEAEAALRKAAATGNLDDIIGNADEEISAQGLMNTVRQKFGDGDQAARLARTVGNIEGASAKNNHFASVSQYDPETGKFHFTDQDQSSKDYRTMKQRQSIFGQHPQNAFRSLQKDTVVVKNAKGPNARTNESGTSVRMSDDLEDILQSAYKSERELAAALEEHGKQISDDVFADMRSTVAAHNGDVNAAFSATDADGNVRQLDRMRQMYDHLINARGADPVTSESTNYQVPGGNYNQNQS